MGVDSCTAGDDECGVEADALNSGQCKLDRAGTAQIIVNDPRKIF